MSQLPALIPQNASRASDGDVAPAVRIQKMIFEEAVEADASDIHIEPSHSSTRVRFRISGILKEVFELPRWMHDSLVIRIKVLGRLDVSERRIPQDGHLSSEESHGLDARVSILPTRWGEKVVIRLLRRGRALVKLGRLGCDTATEEKLQALIRQPEGILLVVGPTGSGKTTTLYAFVNEIRQEPLNIVTIEDPVEYEVDGVSQVQVNEKAGLTFAKALRSILRQDPDVILVGEIRDGETATTAFHAAMTGHLVLATLHATDAVSTFVRLSELGIERSIMSSAVAGIVAQRLVRTNCPACLEADTPRPIYLERLSIALTETPQLRRSPGCLKCDFHGTSGRAALIELLEVQGSVRETIACGSESDLLHAARERGFVSITEQAVGMVRRGTLSVDEAYRTCYFGGA